MEKSFQIEIGDKLMLNKIGNLIAIFGVIIFIAFLFFYFSGSILPAEVSVIYFWEVMGDAFYYSPFVAILLVFIGNEISAIRNYHSSNLIIENDSITFIKNKSQIIIPKERIHKIKEKNILFSKSRKIEITTDTHKIYEFKSNKNLIGLLKEYFPIKTKIKNGG